MKVKVDLSGVANKIGKIATDNRVGLFMAMTCARYMNIYVPERTGNLKAHARINIPFQVVYETDYAKKVFEGNGITIHTDKNPNATSRWDIATENTYKNQIAQEMTKYIERL